MLDNEITVSLYFVEKKKKNIIANINSITGNKLFIETMCCSQYFIARNYVKAQNLHIENAEIVIDDAEIVETFDTFSSCIIETQNTEKNIGITCNKSNDDDAIFRAMEKYNMHPSIIRIENT